MQDLGAHEYLSKAGVLSDQVEAFDYSSPYLDIHVSAVVYVNQLEQVALLDKGDDLAALGHDLQALAGQLDLLVIEHFPLIETSNDLHEHAIEVFVVGRVLIAKLLSLVQQGFH